MTTATPTRPPAGGGRRPAVPPPPPPSGELTSAQWSMTVTPVVAAITTLCASLALSGVIEGLRWWGYAGVAVVVVTAIGLGLRAIRTPILLVGLAQMFAILCLLVSLFTESGVAGFFPGPESLSELGDVLESSIEVVRVGVPPVPATQAVLCLVVIAIGLVAVLVDTLAVSAGTPAACGLVLLCVYAVPASLADDMLPWWAFVLGAVSFSALLAVDGAHRHQLWRNRPTVQGTNGGFGGPAALVSGAIVIALFAGATVTMIGTVGQLPGGAGRGGQGGLGLNPFTSLRGMLDQDDNVELFRVRGMDDQTRYLRAMTLPTYNSNGGWQRDDDRRMPSGVAVDRRLPTPPGHQQAGPEDTVSIQIEPVNSEDYWAPVAGVPMLMQGLPDDMRYDVDSGMVYGEQSRKLSAYVEEADLAEPTSDALKADGIVTDTQEISNTYLRDDGISPAVAELAQQLVAGKPTTFDRVRAIKDYFDIGNGFEYNTQTSSGSDESALEDFLFRSKSGFCEQYASAMGVLLRAAGIPSRVAMGYTAGYDSGQYRTITTQNAHAWVEVYFPSSGWVTFDPTPLSDGTAYTPPYATDTSQTGTEEDPASPSQSSSAPAVPTAPTQQPQDDQTQENAAGGDSAQESGPPPWQWWSTGVIVAIAVALTVLGFMSRGKTATALRSPSGEQAPGGGLPSRLSTLLLPLAMAAWALVLVFLAAMLSWWLAVLVVALVLAAAPGLVRERRRLSKRHDVHGGGPTAATSAWSELLAESRDRGIEVASTETVRTAARRMAREHSLDDSGKRALRTVVSEVERSWYGGQNHPTTTLAPAFDDLIKDIHRNSPLSWRSRLLPRSVLRR